MACKDFNSFIQKFYRAIILLERAVIAIEEEERCSLAKEALECISENLGYVDVALICKRFEEVRFYVVVIRLPLQLADTMNPPDPDCYSIIGNAIRRLKGDDSLSRADRGRYISLIVCLGSESPKRSFHEYLYQVLYDLGPFRTGEEYIEYSGLDVETSVQKVIQASLDEAHLDVTLRDFLDKSNVPMLRSQFKYVKVLADYYYAASGKLHAPVNDHMVPVKFYVRLAHARLSDDVMGQATLLSLNHMRFFLRRALNCANAVKREARRRQGDVGYTPTPGYTPCPGVIPYDIFQSVDLLGKQYVASKFQIMIKDELEAMIQAIDDEKAKELSLNLKSFSQLYDEYVVPFDLREIDVEMQYYASFSSCHVMLETTWARLIDHALCIFGLPLL